MSAKTLQNIANIASTPSGRPKIGVGGGSIAGTRQSGVIFNLNDIIDVYRGGEIFLRLPAVALAPASPASPGGIAELISQWSIARRRRRVSNHALAGRCQEHSALL